VLDAYERLKLTPSVGEKYAPGTFLGRTAQWFQGNILPQTAGGSPQMEKFRIERMQKLHDLQESIAGEYGNIQSREGMGADIKANVKDTWEQIKAKDGQYIGGLRQKYGADVLDAGELVRATQAPIGSGTLSEVAAATVDPLMTRAQQIIQATNGRMTFSDLAALKSLFGDALSPGIQKNVNDAQVGQLFNAVRTDMENYIRNRSPDEYARLKEANRRYAAAMDDFKAHFKKLLGTNDVPVSAERAYEIMSGAATEKGRGDMEKFRQVWDALSPKARGDLSATILGRMGATEKGDLESWQNWQMGKFLTEYRNLTPEAKDMMFSNKKDVRQALDDLVTVSANIQDRIAKLASSSRSGTGAIMLGQLGMLNIIGALVSGPKGMFEAMMVGLGGPWTAAHALTDARFINAISAGVQKFGDGIDGAARAVIDLGMIPRASSRRQPVVPQQIIDQPAPPISR
jgi:hypothetical protein